MAPFTSREIWDNMTHRLSSLSLLKLAFPVQQKLPQVWRIIFKDEKWLNEAECHGLNPVLIGFDLKYHYKFEKSLTIASKTSDKLDEKYLILQPGDMPGDFITYRRDMPELFFSCLKPHKFDKADKLIRLRNELIIYIEAIFDDSEIIKLSDLTKLYFFEKQRRISFIMLCAHRRTRLP